MADAIRAATERLSSSSATARLDAELLMAHALGISRSDMLLGAMAGPAPQEYDAYVARRAAHEPVAYILGEAEFYGRTFAVSPDVLVPRSDSEALVDAALEIIAEKGWSRGVRVLDMGTGSGALLLTILAETRYATGVGIDASDAALKIARYNARALDLKGFSKMGPRDSFRKRDWNQSGWSDQLGKFSLILCNPPYVEDDAPLDPDVRDYEPASALFAGPDGLDDYRVLLPQLGGLLAPDGAAIFEIGHRQADAVAALADADGFTAELLRDLADRPRALILREKGR